MTIIKFLLRGDKPLEKQCFAGTSSKACRLTASWVLIQVQSLTPFDGLMILLRASEETNYGGYVTHIRPHTYSAQESRQSNCGCVL